METFWLIIVGILSIFIVIKSAEYLLLSITNYAKTTGLSEYMIGFIIVALGTSLPELVTGIMSALVKRNELSLGNVIGANIIDTTLVLGITLVFMKKFYNDQFQANKTLYSLFIIILIPLVMGLDGNISRLDGLILVIVFGLYLVTIISREHKLGKIKKSIKIKHVLVDMITFLLALGALLLASRWIVFVSVTVSTISKMPVFLIGLFFIALATTMPETIISVRSALKKQCHLSLGNVFGTVAINSSLVLGISALINPIRFDFSQFLRPTIFMIVAVIITALIFRRKVLKAKHGWLLIFIYVLFVGTELLLYR